MTKIDINSLKDTTEKSSNHTFCEWIKNMNKDKAENIVKSLSQGAEDLIAKFKAAAEVAAAKGKGWATVIVLTEKDFDLIQSKGGFGFNDIIDASIKEAYTELVKTGLVVHAIPESMKQTNLKLHIVATWNDTPLSDITEQITSTNITKGYSDLNEKMGAKIVDTDQPYLVNLGNKTADELAKMATEIKALPVENQTGIILWYLDNCPDVGKAEIKAFLMQFEELLRVIKQKNKPVSSMKSIHNQMLAINADEIVELNNKIANWDKLSEDNADNKHNLSTSERQDWLDRLEELEDRQKSITDGYNKAMGKK